jgi:hypothetical protein
LRRSVVDTAPPQDGEGSDKFIDRVTANQAARNAHAIGVEGSSRFLKKAAQKFLLRWAMGDVADTAHGPA